MKSNIQYLKEEAKIYERGILSLLLEVSKSFSDENFTKEKRDEIFVKIDGLRDKVKDINKVIAELQQSDEDIEEYSSIQKIENNIENLMENKEESEESIKENIECDINHDTEPVEEILTIKKEEIIDIEIVENEVDKEDIQLENKNIRRRNKGRRNRINVDSFAINKNDILEKEVQQSVNESDTDLKDIDYPENNDLEQDIEEIDRLIEEAQNLNSNIIKFPERKMENIEKIEDTDSETLDEKKYNDEDENLDEDNVEPVPVLFGNSRAQNQMIVRKKSNGFSDKLKSLIFKIKTMLGVENEE
jgi:hypothetical protein